jgi:hypothetical protein
MTLLVRQHHPLAVCTHASARPVSCAELFGYHEADWEAVLERMLALPFGRVILSSHADLRLGETERTFLSHPRGATSPHRNSDFPLHLRILRPRTGPL